MFTDRSCKKVRTNFGLPLELMQHKSLEEAMEFAKNYDDIHKEKEHLKNRFNPFIINVWFNEKKGVTVVKWSDDTVTKVTLQNDDVWDEEKGIALCYMKKFSGNNSSFNEILKEYVYDKQNTLPF